MNFSTFPQTWMKSTWKKCIEYLRCFAEIHILLLHGGPGGDIHQAVLTNPDWIDHDKTISGDKVQMGINPIKVGIYSSVWSLYQPQH